MDPVVQNKQAIGVAHLLPVLVHLGALNVERADLHSVEFGNYSQLERAAPGIRLQNPGAIGLVCSSKENLFFFFFFFFLV